MHVLTLYLFIIIIIIIILFCRRTLVEDYQRGNFQSADESLLLECSTHALCESVFWCQAALLG